MIFSKYNYLFDSKKYGYFIYNSRTNSFLKLDKSLYKTLLEHQKSNANNIVLEPETLDILNKSKVFVSQNEDNNFYTQRKFIKYQKCFSVTDMGIVIAPTMACNFMCPYCYEADLPATVMSEEVQSEVIKFIESNNGSNNLTLCWHGGEPLLAFDAMKNILDNIENSDKINLRSHQLVTNGYLLDQDKVEYLKKYNLNSVQITIDGLPERHNQSRKHKSGVPTYDKIINNIENLVKIAPECHVNIRVNIHEDNKEDFPILYNTLSDKWKHNNVNVNMVFTEDFGNCKVKCLSKKEYVDFYKNLKNSHDIKEVSFYPKPKDIGCTVDYTNSCIVGPTGDLYKCWVDLGKEDRIIGNIFSNERNYAILSEYIIGTDIFNDPKCKDCLLFPICDGGCSLFRYEHKLNGTEYNVCPINFEDLPKLLELHYEQGLNKLEE
jgi:uncharacterized protein